MADLPWFKMVAADYLGDIKLKRTSFATRGVYIELLCVAFQCDERGVFITEGIVWTKDEIIRSISGDINEISAAFDELIRWKRFRQREDGAYYNSRMVRDEAERAGNAKRQADQRDRENAERNQSKSSKKKVTAKVTEKVTPIVTQEVTEKVTPEITVQSTEYREESLRVLEEKNLRVLREEDDEENAQAREKPSSTSSKSENFQKSDQNPKAEAAPKPEKEIPPDSAAPPLSEISETARLRAGWVWLNDWYERALNDQLYLQDAARFVGLTKGVAILTELQKLLGPWLRRFLKEEQALEGKKNFLVDPRNKRMHFKNWLNKRDMEKDPTNDQNLYKSKVDKDGKDPHDTSWAYAKLGISKPGQRNASDPVEEVETTWEPVQPEGSG